MRAEITFFGGVIFGVDKNGVVWTRRHACLATNADRFIEVDDSIFPLEHSGGRTSSYTGRMNALIAACYLVSSSSLGKDADINVFDVSASDGKRDDVFRFTCGGAGMTTDASSVVDYLRPLNWAG